MALEGLSHCQQHEGERLAREAARKARAKLSASAARGLDMRRSRKWQRESRSFLARHPLCVDCAGVGLVVPATEVDHIKRHEGDRRLFWDRSNWQPLCKSCHSRKTAREVWHG